MMPVVEIGVRYCGGCNPTYDRVAVVKRLGKLLPELSFVNAQPGRSYPAVLIVSGCATACTGTGDLAVPEDRQIRIGSFADLLPSRDRIRMLLAEEEAQALDRAQIAAILPHRPPMLFVDAVSRLVPGREAAAQLYLDPSWALFQGHFPGAPVFPGALAIEAMAQTADLMAMTQDCYAGRMPLLMEVGRARFLRKMEPGMTLQLRASRKEERRDIGVVVCRCQALAAEKPVPAGADIAPGDVPGETAPGDVPGETAPGAASGKTASGDVPGETAPGAASGKAVPGDVSGETVPGAVPAGNTAAEKAPAQEALKLCAEAEITLAMR